MSTVAILWFVVGGVAFVAGWIWWFRKRPPTRRKPPVFIELDGGLGLGDR